MKHVLEAHSVSYLEDPFEVCTIIKYALYNASIS